VVLFAALASPAGAEVTHMAIIHPQSTIKFEAVQNSAPVSGEFANYDGDIYFSPDDLAGSRATVTVRIDSLETTYHDMTETLRGADWLDVNKFPQAKFETVSFKKIDANNYEATGKLTIRDKTEVVPFKFTLKEYKPG